MPIPALPLGYVEPFASRPTDFARRCHSIETLWTVRADEERDFLVLPDGRADLIVRFKITASADRGGVATGEGMCVDVVPMVVGPSTRPRRVPLVPGDGFVGVRLRPGRLSVLSDAAGLADQRLTGADAAEIVPALASLPSRAPSSKAMIRAVHKMVEHLPDQSPVTDLEDALDQLHLAGGRIEPGALARSLGIGARRLHRLFARHVGLSPRGYAGVLRFQRAVRLRRRGMTLAECAHEAGYSDQPHMNRAFRRHGGFTPARIPDVVLGSMPVR